MLQNREKYMDAMEDMWTGPTEPSLGAEIKSLRTESLRPKP